VLLGFQNESEQRLAEFCHANEHMGAKFTSQKYKDGSKLTERLQQLGVRSNASTSVDETSYFMTGPKRSSRAMLDIFLHSIVEPFYDPKLFDSEMRAVENELQNIVASTWYIYENEESKILYPNTPLGRTEEDRIANVRRLRKQGAKGSKELMDWRLGAYKPERCCVFLHGNLERAALHHIRKKLGKMKCGQVIENCPTSRPVSQPTVVTVPPPEIGSMHRLTVLRQLPFDGRQLSLKAATSCALSVLGDGLGSRLYRRLRRGGESKGEKGGLAYAVTCSATYHKCGNLPSFFYVDVKFQTHETYKTKTAEEVLRRIQLVLNEFAEKGPTDTEMKTWRTALSVGDAYYSYERNVSQNPLLADNYWEFVRPQLLYADLPETMETFTGCTPAVGSRTSALLEKINLEVPKGPALSELKWNHLLGQVEPVHAQTVMREILTSPNILVTTADNLQPDTLEDAFSKLSLNKQ
jgi:predicted Zn-dependent peptidase